MRTISLAFALFLSCVLSVKAQVAAYQIVSIDIPATLNAGSGFGAIGQLFTRLSNVYRGTAPVLNATPRFQINIDPSGQHGLSALPGSYQSVSLTRSGTSWSVSVEPLGVGIDVNIEGLPDFVSYEVKIENERVVLVVVQRKKGIETTTSIEAVQIYRTLQPLRQDPDYGVMQLGYLRIMSSSFLRAYATLGPIEVVDDGDDDGEDDSAN